jgi:hypothetical protein
VSFTTRLSSWNAPRGPTSITAEHGPQRAGRTAVLQVSSQRLAGTIEQRQNALPVILAGMDQKLPLPPVDILPTQPNDFTGAKAQMGQQEQDRAVAKALDRTPPRNREHSLKPEARYGVL